MPTDFRPLLPYLATDTVIVFLFLIREEGPFHIMKKSLGTSQQGSPEPLLLKPFLSSLGSLLASLL